MPASWSCGDAQEGNPRVHACSKWQLPFQKGPRSQLRPFPQRRQGRCRGRAGGGGVTWCVWGGAGRWRGERRAVPGRRRARFPGAGCAGGSAAGGRRTARAAPLLTQKAPRPAGRGTRRAPWVLGLRGWGQGSRGPPGEPHAPGRGAGVRAARRGAGRSATPFGGLGLPQAASRPHLPRRGAASPASRGEEVRRARGVWAPGA